jgi:histone acetyltransferase
MEERLEQNYYYTLDMFIADMARIFQNCRVYNGEDTVYSKCANKLEAFFKSRFNYRSKLLRENV